MKSIKSNVAYFQGLRISDFWWFPVIPGLRKHHFHPFRRAAAQSKCFTTWCEALSSISHVQGSRRAKFPNFRFSVISELQIEIWFLLSDPSLSGTHETSGVEFEHSFECVFRKSIHRKEKYQIECCISLGAQNLRFLMISGDLRASKTSFLPISARSSAKQMFQTWCEALSSISHVQRSRRAKCENFRFSVIFVL